MGLGTRDGDLDDGRSPEFIAWVRQKMIEAAAQPTPLWDAAVAGLSGRDFEEVAAPGTTGHPLKIGATRFDSGQRTVFASKDEAIRARYEFLRSVLKAEKRRLRTFLFFLAVRLKVVTFLLFLHKVVAKLFKR
jgi:hypothetical protein